MIPDIIELNFPKKGGKQYATLTHAEVKHEDMGEKTITTQVKIDGEITPDFTQDWAVEFQGEKYIMPLRIPQGAKENTSLDSTIDLTFQHWAIYQLKRWPFVTIQQIAAGTYLPDEEVATVSLNLGDFCELFGQVLDYYYGGAITIDFNDDPVTGWKYKQEATVITISHTKIWNVLIDAFHGKYGVRWEIKAASDNSNTVKGGERYVIRVGYPTTEVDHIFEYGFEGGLLKVERQVQSDEIRNMLKGRGGDTNIPRFYFKQVPEAEKEKYSYRDDPDWVEELANIYFPNLMPATFRSYVQGWKAAHINQTDADGKKIYAGYTPVGESNAYAPWAYRKGYTDTKFSPVEFVADEITIEPQDGDKQEEILPGYSPYVKKGSSLDKYGPLPDTLDNNEETYPTLQGTGMDIAVAVEEITADGDVKEEAESDAVISNAPGCRGTARDVAGAGYKTANLVSKGTFRVPAGKTANLDVSLKVLEVTDAGNKGYDVSAAETSGTPTIKVFAASDTTGTWRSASGIPAGTWRYEVEVQVHNRTTDKALNITVGDESPRLMDATLTATKGNTFDIWVKNIWDTTKLSTETNAQYSERVWKPVLGDREGNEAKVMFTSGDLALSEDYEFTIVGFPVPDPSKTYIDGNGVTHTSHWRITLAKSDAELEATGLYVPSKQKQGKAGDRFVFIGTEMTHVPYVVDAEEHLDDWKKDQLGEKKEIKPTFVVTTDRVRLNNEGKPNALVKQLRVGNSIRLADKRFISNVNDSGQVVPSSAETRYLQSITYKYREPTSDDAALNPDVDITLGSEYAVSGSTVSMMQSEISALQRQVGAISNVEQIVRAVGDKLYLRKDGISDRSYSPTSFYSLVTSGDFRSGLVGGAGWGFFKDENGNWVLEVPRLNVRQDMQVNNLVINQVSARGGMEVDTAAFIEAMRVVETQDGYLCYFDQKGGSVANLFQLDDVAYCTRWDAENTRLKFYKRRVTGIGADYIKLTKFKPTSERPAGWTDGGSNGLGIPAEGDNIIHFGNYTDKTRQYVKVRDVVGGGYERYLGGLDSVNAEGTEYFFVGRQSGMYGNRPRLFIGDSTNYLEYREGELIFNGKLTAQSYIGDFTLDEYITSKAAEAGVGDLDMGVTNLLRDSGFSSVKVFVTYQYLEFELYEKPSQGETCTLTIWGRPLNDGSFYVQLPGQTGKIKVDSVGGNKHKCTFAWVSSGDSNVIRIDVATESGSSAGGAVLKVKLERGNVGTDWTPCPADFDYITHALRSETTTIAGGLMLTSMVSLGYTTSSGQRVTTAGINGVRADATSVSFWSGGGMNDAKYPTPENGETATFLVRHDGTAYASGNLIRFEKQGIEIGKTLEFKENLFLLKDRLGNSKFMLTNDSIGVGEDYLAALGYNNLIDYPTGVSFGLPVPYGTAAPSGGGSAVNIVTFAPSDSNTGIIFEKKVNLKKGDRISLQGIRAEVTIPSATLATLNDVYMPKLRLFLVQKGYLLLVRDSQFYKGTSATKATCQAISTEDDIVVSEDGELTLRIAGTGPTGVSSPSYSQIVQCQYVMWGEGAYLRDFNDCTLMGNDGLVTMWGDAESHIRSLLFVNRDTGMMQYGKNQIKIDSEGVHLTGNIYINGKKA